VGGELGVGETMSEQDTWETCKHGHYVACIDCLREELERVNGYANSADAVADGLRLELGETQREVERLTEAKAALRAEVERLQAESGAWKDQYIKLCNLLGLEDPYPEALTFETIIEIVKKDLHERKN